jgi:hypothetical protein
MCEHDPKLRFWCPISRQENGQIHCSVCLVCYLEADDYEACRMEPISTVKLDGPTWNALSLLHVELVKARRFRKALGEFK